MLPLFFVTLEHLKQKGTLKTYWKSRTTTIFTLHLWRKTGKCSAWLCLQGTRLWRLICDTTSKWSVSWADRKTRKLCKGCDRNTTVDWQKSLCKHLYMYFWFPDTKAYYFWKLLLQQNVLVDMTKITDIEIIVLPSLYMVCIFHSMLHPEWGTYSNGRAEMSWQSLARRYMQQLQNLSFLSHQSQGSTWDSFNRMDTRIQHGANYFTQESALGFKVWQRRKHGNNCRKDVLEKISVRRRSSLMSAWVQGMALVNVFRQKLLQNVSVNEEFFMIPVYVGCTLFRGQWKPSFRCCDQWRNFFSCLLKRIEFSKLVGQFAFSKIAAVELFLQTYLSAVTYPGELNEPCDSGDIWDSEPKQNNDQGVWCVRVIHVLGEWKTTCQQAFCLFGWRHVYEWHL